MEEEDVTLEDPQYEAYPVSLRALSTEERQHAIEFSELCSADGNINGDMIYKGWRAYANWKRVRGDSFYEDSKSKIQKGKKLHLLKSGAFLLLCKVKNLEGLQKKIYWLAIKNLRETSCHL